MSEELEVEKKSGSDLKENVLRLTESLEKERREKEVLRKTIEEDKRERDELMMRNAQVR